MVKITFYAPKENAEQVKLAMFNAGAGRIGNYDSCCWQVLGQGQFRPLDGSNPHLGSQGSVEQVNEYRVEMVCEESLIKEVVQAMKKAHPYETPAYDIVKILDF
jgi:hypothetical protein